MNGLKQLEEYREELITRIQMLPSFRPGTIVTRYRKCGRKNCHCAKEGDPGHGPSYSITHKVKGKTVAKYIRKEFLAQTEMQIEAWNEFQEIVKELTQTNIKICDAKLELEKQASQEVKKKGSAKKSNRP